MSDAATRKILALDPAAITGWCWSDGTIRHHGVWAIAGTGQEPRGLPLCRLYDRCQNIATRFGIEQLVFEASSMGSSARAAQTAHDEKRGVLIMFAARLDVPWGTVHPMTLHKFAAGRGDASKSDMIRAAKIRLGLDLKSHDEADAVWLQEIARHELVETAKKREARKRERQPREKQGKFL